MTEKYDTQIDALITLHKGSARAAIESLLINREMLIKEVEYASRILGSAAARAGL